MAIFRIYNGPMPTSAAQVPVTTGTAVKTMLQVKASTTKPMKVKAWGVSLDGSAAATPGKWELFAADSGSGSTVTAHVAAGIHKIDGDALACGDPTTNLIPVGTTSTGYTSSGEGTNTSLRMFDAQLIAPTNQYIFQWPLGQEPIVQVAELLKVRCTLGAAVNAICWVDVEV